MDPKMETATIKGQDVDSEPELLSACHMTSTSKGYVHLLCKDTDDFVFNQLKCAWYKVDKTWLVMISDDAL